MKATLRNLLAAAVAAAGLASCALEPRSDGGIVGSGNRPECEPRTRSDGTPLPLPEHCKPR
jgi:hypothetical protein